ncbi:hypothetical protein ACIHDR_45130 [Nocardia sp. NPDC052278]|uniref:hypothetical protein n=1 Tax=unclassified Nocardia TaxID=2637762 RepID=UPI0036B59FE9
MTTLYTVQCNFNRPDLEAEWNDWYNGPKTAHMLAKPLFLRAQRFEAYSFDTDVKYLAMWELESAAALESPEYKATWGWDRWQPMIDDWVRDLSASCDPSGRVPFIEGVSSAVYVHLAWFDDGVDRTRLQALAARGVETSSWWWGSCRGLDNSARTIAVTGIGSEADVPSEPIFGPSARRETVYRSISALAHAHADVADSGRG